ncbi:hypothetical protein BD309DRAFT_988017 [Dichomitus squalens]|uniref:Uncharacterized protein n=1 Tax=Dichomitus squalens TaxID=114155 RepID=A0A4V6MWV1_9APHY|nr:hypothetical protein BD309DRAFT_988017 [Dichomitus squalens]TBU60598.1 hypothetical protein BD310DRAFT_947319 [Dichomitus squalens]
MSETGRFPRPPASEGSRSPESHPLALESELGPAFSLNNSPINLETRIGSKGSVTEALTGSVDCLPPQDPSDDRGNIAGPPPRFRLGLHPNQAAPDLEGDELLDLFSVLGLDEDQKWSSFKRADDSGVVLSSDPYEGDSQWTSAKAGRVGRKRGDTIRASDYTKPPVLVTSGSLDSASTLGSSGSRRPSTRRTRSGTVTQASSSSSSTRRKHEGWPTIRMRTNPEPLRADENEDDELLLKDGDVIE